MKYTLYIAFHTWGYQVQKTLSLKMLKKKKMALTTITFSIRDFEIYTIYTSVFQCENHNF